MSKRKTGRVRCGRCERVLSDPGASRTPRAADRADIDQLDGIEKGRAMYGASRPKSERVDNLGNTLEPAPGEFECRCGSHYAPVDLAGRRLAAVERGEDLYLTVHDAARHAR